MDHTYFTQLIGSGAQADVYLYENKAIKVFKPDYGSNNVEFEAKILNRIYNTGLPVPKFYDVISIKDRTAIVMEYVNGETLGNLLLKDSVHGADYIEQSVLIQQRIHQIKNVEGIPLLKDKLQSKIKWTTIINEEMKQKCIEELGHLNVDYTLCHGDFHVLNLIKTDSDIKIIDWVDASLGCAAADVCRTYLLYLLYKREIADLYLQCYCDKAKLTREEVLSWLSVLAAARLVENNAPEDVEILLSIINREFCE